MADEQQSSYKIIENALSQYGLTGLESFIETMIFESGITDFQTILARLRVEPTSTEAGRIYQERFKANKIRIANGLSALGEGEYIGLEDSLKQVMRVKGMPEGFYDSNDDLANFIGNDVSASELSNRIEVGYQAVKDADPIVVDEMRRLYGVSNNQLAAYFLDPTKGEDVIKRQAQAAIIAGEAQTAAGMQLTATTAEELARAGVTEQQAQSGFGAIRQAQELFGATTQEQQAGEQVFTQAEQIGAVFGTSAAAQQRLRQRARRRQAAFEAGGGFAGQGAQLTGLQ